MNINLKVSDELNEERKKLGATWRDLINIGLNTLKGNPALIAEAPKDLPKKIDPAVGEHLKSAIQGISEAWKLIKEASKETTP